MHYCWRFTRCNSERILFGSPNKPKAVAITNWPHAIGRMEELRQILKTEYYLNVASDFGLARRGATLRSSPQTVLHSGLGQHRTDR